MPVGINPAVPFTVSATFRDNNGNRATSQVNIPSDTNFVEQGIWVPALALVLEALSDAVLERITVGQVFEQTATPIPGATSEVERKLVIPLRGAGNVRGLVTVPSPVFGLEVDGTDNINTLNPAYQALAQFLLNGTPGADNGAVNQTGQQYNAIASAPYITHRGRGRGR